MGDKRQSKEGEEEEDSIYTITESQNSVDLHSCKEDLKCEKNKSKAL